MRIDRGYGLDQGLFLGHGLFRVLGRRGRPSLRAGARRQVALLHGGMGFVGVGVLVEDPEDLGALVNEQGDGEAGVDEELVDAEFVLGVGIGGFVFGDGFLGWGEIALGGVGSVQARFA